MAAEKRRILVVDNDEDFLRIVKLNLEETGRYEVRTESRGVHCMADILTFQPELILLDVVIDDIGGEEVASHICGHYFSKDIPVIYVTGVLPLEKKSKYNLCGGYPLLYKPVSLADLLAAIEENIKKK